MSFPFEVPGGPGGTVSKVLLVGESNPYGTDPRFALYPEPPGCAGARLCAILGMTDREYLRTFDRWNLCALTWSNRSARNAAARLTAKYRVLLGARVAAAHGVEFIPFARVDGRGARRGWLVLPHPSGRSRLWNEPGAADSARELVTHLVREAAYV